MKEYLTIGEVAKLKKITIKALRYYEKIGIFIPAYISAETGYRYYRMEQMVLLDFILICVELGIPLKRFPVYLEKDGTLDIDRILQDGTSMAKQEIARINRTANKLKHMSLHLEESDQLPVIGSSFIQSFPQRFLLLKPMQELYPTQKQYITALTDLYFQMEVAQHISLYKQGLLYMKQEGKLQCYVCNEVDKQDNQEQTLTLPAGDFYCQYIDGCRDTPWLEWMRSLVISNEEKDYILLQERYTRKLSTEPLWEVQSI